MDTATDAAAKITAHLANGGKVWLTQGFRASSVRAVTASGNDLHVFAGKSRKLVCALREYSSDIGGMTYASVFAFR